jgi:hypothetical protein
MILPGVEFVPDAVLERRAIDLIREHERRRGVRVGLPIPIEAIVEQTLGLKVVWVAIEEAPGEIILARIDPAYLGHPTIQLNERRLSHFEEFFGTEAFSLAHEAGHWVLHLGRGESRQVGLIDSVEDDAMRPVLCRRMNDGDRRELQADRFAAFLLMPEYLVRGVLAGFELDRWTGVADLARRCGVSKRAMTRRLQELRVVPSDGVPPWQSADSHRRRLL